MLLLSVDKSITRCNNMLQFPLELENK